MTANDLISHLLIRVPQAFPTARVWRLNNGAFYNPAGRLIRVGPKGLPDVDGWIGIDGRAVRLAIEVKVGRDKMSPEQESFKNALNAAGGIYVIARTVEDCIAALQARV